MNKIIESIQRIFWVDNRIFAKQKWLQFLSYFLVISSALIFIREVDTNGSNNSYNVAFLFLLLGAWLWVHKATKYIREK